MAGDAQSNRCRENWGSRKKTWHHHGTRLVPEEIEPWHGPGSRGKQHSLNNWLRGCVSIIVLPSSPSSGSGWPDLTSSSSLGGWQEGWLGIIVHTYTCIPTFVHVYTLYICLSVHLYSIHMYITTTPVQRHAFLSGSHPGVCTTVGGRRRPLITARCDLPKCPTEQIQRTQLIGRFTKSTILLCQIWIFFLAIDIY